MLHFQVLDVSYYKYCLFSQDYFLLNILARIVAVNSMIQNIHFAIPFICWYCI